MNHKHIKKLTEIEGYLLDEIEFCQANAKKMKRFDTITGIVDTSLTASAVISGVGLSISIALSGTSLLLSLATVIK